MRCCATPTAMAALGVWLLVAAPIPAAPIVAAQTAQPPPDRPPPAAASPTANATAAHHARPAPPSAGPAPLRVGLEADPDQVAPLLARFDGGACPPIAGRRWLDPEAPSRIEGELLILCNALALGGWPGRIALVYGHSYNRSLAETLAGRLDLPTQTVWESEIAANPDALIGSAPVVRRGEWAVGLYTTENRAEALRGGTPEGVRRLVGAAPRGWVEDWRALESLGLAGLLDVQDNALIPALIAVGRADFTLLAFGRGPDMARRDGRAGLRLLPIRGVKLPLDASRHFAVSRARADAAEVVAAIDAGLATLRAQGQVQAVLREVGLLDPRVADWVALRPLDAGAATVRRPN